MAWALVESSSCFPCAVSGGSKICSKQSGNTKRAVIKVLCSSLQTPPIYMRVRTFSGEVNSLCNMVNRSHDFHLTVAAAASEKVSLILPKGKDMFETFTDKANEVIKFAQKETRRAGYKFVGPEMILLGLIGNDIERISGESTDIAAKVLYSMDIYLEDARHVVQDILVDEGQSHSVRIQFTTHALSVFKLALAEAQKLGHNYIGSEHLLLGLLRKGGDVNLVLRKLGARPKTIRTQVMRMIEESAAKVVGDGSSGDEMPILEDYGLNLIDVGKTSIVGDGSSGNEKPFLELYCDNLTKHVYEKKLYPVVERKPLVNKVIQNLGRLSKKNLCLVGERGVGKKSIVQSLAQRIADCDVPDFLSNKKVISLYKMLLFNEGMRDIVKKLMEEIKGCNEIVLFIDNVHIEDFPQCIFDPCNILMQALARNEVQCVVATTPDEYLKSMKKFPALERLFQPINVPEATVEETIEILRGLRERYENCYGVRFADEALVAAARMSDQVIRHSFLPSKAIDLLHLASPFVSNKEIEQISMLRQMGYKINKLEAKQRMDEKNLSVGPTTITKADIEDLLSDISHLQSINDRLFGDADPYEEMKAWPNLYKLF